MFKVLSAALILSGSLVACAPVAKEPVIHNVESDGQCRVSDWESYVGKLRQSLPAAPDGLSFRVLCKECAATMDYRSDRVNFVYGDDDRITRVTCG